MVRYNRNHYILLLQNNYTREIRSFDVENTSCDPRYYLFENFEFPTELPPGEYTYALTWCILEYSLKFDNDILDTVITVRDKDGEYKSFKFKQLDPEVGLLKYEADSHESFLQLEHETQRFSLEENPEKNDSYFLEKTAEALKSLEKVEDYLYEITFDDYDWSRSEDYFRKNFVPMGNCSAFVSGNSLCRSFDWYASDKADFIVKVNKSEARHGSISVSSSLISENDASSPLLSRRWQLVPFMSTDGINDAGVSAAILTVPSGDYGITSGTNPGKSDLCMLSVVRFILDYADSARHAVELLGERNVWAPYVNGVSQEAHFLVKDGNESLVIEFVNNEMKIVESDKATNFYLFGWDGSKGTLTPHAQGLERFEILSESTGNAWETMESLMYTRLYDRETAPYWYSDWNGFTKTFGDLNIWSSPEEYQGIIEYGIEQYERGELDSTWWESIHSCLIWEDEEELKIELASRENFSEKYLFTFEK